MNRAAVAALFLLSCGALLVARQQGTAKPPVTQGRDPGVQGQPGPPLTGAITGTLSALDSGRAVRRAKVTLSGGDVRKTTVVTTDDRGAFSFTELSGGEYTLSASRGGYLDVVFGQRQPGTGQPGTPIRLAAGQRLDRVPLRIPRGGVITGTIVDEAGEPAFNTPIRAFRYSWRTGERTLQQAGSGTTDDRGIYRIPALPPGDYVVSAVPREATEASMAAEVKMRMAEEMAAVARMSGNPAAMDDAKMAMARSMTVTDPTELTSGYAPVYYFGTTQPSAAATVTLGVSEEKSGVDMQLQIVPLATVSGTVSGAQGPVTAQVQLIDRSAPAGFGNRSTRSTGDGTFSFTAVPPGQYVIVARGGARETPVAVEAPKDPAARELAMALVKMAPMSPSMWAMADITVNGRSVPNLVLALQPGMNVSGSITFEGAMAPPAAQLARINMTLTPVGPATESPSVSPAQVDAEGRFTIRGVAPGFYRVVAAGGVPGGFTAKSSMFAGRDSLDFPIEVKPGEDLAGGQLIFSTKTADVAGTLLDPANAPAPGYTVVIFAADSRFWTPQSRRIQATRPATDGRFSLRSLPAGDYRIVAVTDIEQGQWFDPALLRQIGAASVALTLGEGEHKIQDLRIK